MKLTPKQVEAAKNRRLKEPLEISGSEITITRVQAVGQGPKVNQTPKIWRIETIGDIARLDAHIRLGKFVPMPDLSLQAILIVIDKLGLLEERKDDDG